MYLQLSIGVAVLCLPWLRWAQPNLPRPIRVNLAFPIVYLIATVFVTVVPMIASPVETGYGILMILTSIPVYLIFIAWKNKPKWFQSTMGKYSICKCKALTFQQGERGQNVLCIINIFFCSPILSEFIKKNLSRF